MVVTKRISLQSKGHGDIIDVTPQVEQQVAGAGINDGTVTLFVTSLLGASLVIPFNDKRLALGTWQQIVVVDFDNRSRSRQIVLQIMGD